MPRIAFWAAQAGGTAWYRCYGPAWALQQVGWDVECFDKELLVTPDGEVKDSPDFLVVSRIGGDNAVDIVTRAQRHGALVIYDTDDWFRGLPGYNPASQLPPDRIDTMHRAMAAADLVTCSTPELAEGYADLNRCIVLPNYLHPGLWRHAWMQRKAHDAIHIGWLGAFNWRGADVDLLKPWLPRFLRDHPEVRFLALGCPELLDYLGIAGFTTHPTSADPRTPDRHVRPYENLPTMLSALDIGLVPLDFNRFNQSKSWCKGLEYNAMGIPAIASPSREYRTYIRPGVNGYLVRGQEWARTVERAIDNLEELQRGARAIADEHFIDGHIDEWVDVYESLRDDRLPGQAPESRLLVGSGAPAEDHD